MPDYEIVQADIVDWLENYDGPKFHAVLSDPPYGLAFMGKKWDKFRSNGDFQKWVESWSRLLIEKALYPGAVCLFFGGTRTFHRLFCGLEDGGMDVADTLAYMYGSGFPKGYNLTKAIEGNLLREFQQDVFHLIRTIANYQCGCSLYCRQCGELLHGGQDNDQDAEPLLIDAPECSHLFETLKQTLEGIGHKCTASSCGLFDHLSRRDYLSRKDADAWLLFLAVSSCLCPPCFAQLIADASADEARQADIDWNNIDALSVATAWAKSQKFYRILCMSPEPYNQYNIQGEKWQGWNVSLKPAWEPVALCRAPRKGYTYARLALEFGTGGLWIGGTRINHNEAQKYTERTARRCGNALNLNTGQGNWTEGNWQVHHPKAAGPPTFY